MKIRHVIVILAVAAVAACGGARAPEVSTRAETALNPGETPELRRLINTHADRYDVPRALVHRVVQRESDYRPQARNGPYYGMMQIRPETARGIGFRGLDRDLLDPAVNLNWGVKYLRGAWMVADGDMDAAVSWYARGYYYAARDRCLLVKTGLREREVARHCRA